jgi:hypothetical protein
VGRPLPTSSFAPDIDPLALQQAVYEAFAVGNGISPVEQLREDRDGLARQCGIPAHDEHGNLPPNADDAITRTVTAAIWFGITTGYLPLAGSYRISAGTCTASQGWECCGPRTGMGARNPGLADSEIG